MINEGEPQSAPPLYGLIAAGGHSVRMGREKGGMSYGGRPQVRRLYDRLTPVCRAVYVSIRDEQSEQFWCDDLPQIHDLFQDLGPVSGLLSAMIRHPHAAWLFVACDMPFVGRRAVQRLVEQRDPSQRATVYTRRHSRVFEPIFGIYEPAFRETIRNELGSGNRSLQRMLEQEPVRTVQPGDDGILKSVDRPSEFHRVQRFLRGAYHV